MRECEIWSKLINKKTTLNIFHTFFNVSIVDFEKVFFAGLGLTENYFMNIRYLYGFFFILF